MAEPEPRAWRRRDGVRKLCKCKVPTKCQHGWFFSLMYRGVHHRVAASKVAKLPRGTTMGKTEADRLFASWKATVIDAADNPSPAPPAPTRTIGEVLADYERDFVGVKSRRPDATADMLWLTGWWKKRLKDRPIANVTAAEVRALIDERHTRAKVKGSKGGRVTSNRLLGRLRHFYNWCIERDLVESSPFQTRRGQPKLRILKAGIESARTRRLRPGEEDALLEAAPGDLKCIVVALLDTAMRIGELTALTFADVDLTRGTLTVRAETAKTATGREVPITSRVKAILEARAIAPDGQPHQPSAFVFGNAIGERVHPDAVRRAWEAACGKAKVEGLHIHDLRREAASRLLEAGVALHTVSRWLGHSTVVQTSVYLASTADRLHDAVKLLEARTCKKVANSTDTPAPPQTDVTPGSGQNLQLH